VRRLVLLVAGLLSPLLLYGSEVTRPPWEWTLEERIRDRSDPVKARQRAERRAASANGVTAMGAAPKLDGDSIDGHRNPELFLPIELFRIFVSGAFTEDPAGRAVYRQARVQASSAALPKDFWTRLETITHSYVTTLSRARALNREAVWTCVGLVDRLKVRSGGGSRLTFLELHG